MNTKVPFLGSVAVAVIAAAAAYGCSTNDDAADGGVDAGTTDKDSGTAPDAAPAEARPFAAVCEAGDDCMSGVCCLPGMGCGPGGGAGGGGGGGGNGGGAGGGGNFWCSARCDAGSDCPNRLDGDAGLCSANRYCQR